MITPPNLCYPAKINCTHWDKITLFVIYSLDFDISNNVNFVKNNILKM